MKWSRSIFFVAFVLASTAASVSASEYQEETLELAEELTEEPDPELQRAAFLAIGHLGSDEQQDSLDDYKERRGLEERLAVGTALILAGDPEGTTFVAEQALEASETIDALGDISVHLSDQQLSDVFDAVIDEASSRQRAELFSVLATRTGSLYANLTDRLTSGDEDERQAALEAIKQTAGPDALEVAEGLVGHSDADVRRQVFDIVEAVGQRSDLQSQIAELLGELTNDTDEDIRYRAARTLVERGEQKGAEFLISRLSDMEPDRRVENLEWLVQYDAEADLGDIRPLIDELERAMIADDDLDRDHEWQLLYELAATDSDNELLQDLREKFTSTEFEDRIASVRSLARTGCAEVKQHLLDGLGEGRSDIRRFSARGLGQLGDPETLSELQVALRSETDISVKVALVDAVGQIRDREAVNVLRFMVTDDNPEVRMEIVEALGNIGLPESTQGLTMLVRDRDDDIGWRAFINLLEIDPDEARRHIGSALQNPPEDFADYIDPEKLSEDGRQLLYEEILTHSTSRVYSVGLEDAVAYPDEILPIARQLLTSDDLDEAARKELVLLFADRAADEDLASFERIFRLYSDEPAAELAGWYLAKTANEAFEETFEVVVQSHDVGDDPTVRYLIANLALANIE